MSHPLEQARARITADAPYTVRDLAELLGVSVQSIRALDHAGYLPGAVWSSIPGRGGGRYTWAGEQLLACLDMDLDDLPPLDHDRYDPSTLWRLGCACADCTAWHAKSTRAYRQRAREQRFPPEKREELLALVRTGTPVKVAAPQVGMTHHQVYALARTNAEFGRCLDTAGEALCVSAADSRCGTHAGYRHLTCRGTACRKAHAPETRPAPTSQ
ncbi:helix-turn-helix domain-containing protein [Kitasatospora sp. NPDC059146]|uniref:helix-turn-helix domain-containing protein n=1 Tax=unclassified Kitasatospora TaxID=2633591 RepID=UPI0036799241